MWRHVKTGTPEAAARAAHVIVAGQEDLPAGVPARMRATYTAISYLFIEFTIRQQNGAIWTPSGPW